MSGYGLAELERRLANVLRIGTVVAVDAGAARVRVTFGGDTESALIPFAVARAGAARVWSPPSVGEQVTVFSPGGDTAQAVVMGSVYSAAAPAPSSDGEVVQVNLPNNVIVTIAGGNVTIEAPGDVTIGAGGAVNIAAPGNVVVAGDVIADGVSLRAHRHGGVQGGSSTTAGPQ